MADESGTSGGYDFATFRLHNRGANMVDDTKKKLNPDYYTRGEIETKDFIYDKGLNYFEGNVIKYIVRWRRKNGIEDLEKARQYLDFLIEYARDEAGQGGEKCRDSMEGSIQISDAGGPDYCSDYYDWKPTEKIKETPEWGIARLAKQYPGIGGIKKYEEPT